MKAGAHGLPAPRASTGLARPRNRGVARPARHGGKTGSAAHSMLRGAAACGKSSTKSPWFGAAGRAVASRPGPRGSRRRWMAGPAKTAPFPERRWKRPYTRARNSMEAAFGAGTYMMSRRVRLTRVGVEQWCKRRERGRSEILPWSLGPAVAVRCGAMWCDVVRRLQGVQRTAGCGPHAPWRTRATGRPHPLPDRSLFHEIHRRSENPGHRWQGR